MHKKKKILKVLFERIKSLQGDPHHVAMGMAAGVFVAVTPTIPFHTVLALLLAALVRGSKVAAAVGVWFSNPFTIPIFYAGSYKLGVVLLGKKNVFDTVQIVSIADMMKIGADVTVAMILGGVTLGIVPAVLSYFITRWSFILLKRKK